MAVVACTLALGGLFVLFLAARPLNDTHVALEHSRAFVQTLIAEAPDGLFVSDLEGRYTDVNAAGCALLGYSREEIL
jgi:PAS domain-containing protein